jgi:hypothetical protein
MSLEPSKPSLAGQLLKTELRRLSLLLLVFIVLAFIFSLILPLGEAADEEEHFGLIRFIAEQGRPPLTRLEQVSISSKGDASPVYHTLVAWLTQHVDISDLPDLPDPRQDLRRAIPSDRLPFKGLYHTEDEAWPWRGIVLAWHLARLVSIPLGALIVVGIFLSARAVYPHRSTLIMAATLFAAFIPRFVINASIVSDDNLVIPLITFAFYFLIRIAQGDTQPRTFIILGILMGLAAITKYHSLLLLPEMTLLLLILAWRHRDGWRAWFYRWGLVVLAFGLTAGWWFGFLLVRFNRVAELGLIRGVLAPLGDPVLTGGAGRVLNQQAGVQLGYEAPLGWLEWSSLLFQTFWFRYGRGHIIDSPAINGGLALLTILAIIGLAVRLWRADLRWNRWRLDLALLALHLLLYLGLVATRYLSLPTRETAQGRHLYPALIAIALFMALGWTELLAMGRRWSRRTVERGVALAGGGLMIAFCVATLPLFILPVYYPYLPITTLDPARLPIQHRLEHTADGGIKLLGYTVAPTTAAGESLAVTLYWQATARLDQDYLVRLCLHDPAGRPVCRWGHPVDGRYPTRAWEEGYVVRDELYLPTPRCLPPGEYELLLGIQPLRLNSSATEMAGIPSTPALSLGEVTVMETQIPPSTVRAVWVGPQRYERGKLRLPQIRQALTVIDYGQAPPRPSLLAASSGDREWPQITPPLVYPCPAGPLATIHSFIVDPDIQPAAYAPLVAEQSQNELQLVVATRHRTYQPPADIPTRLNASFGSQVELLGYGMDLSPRWPGQTIDIEVFWRSLTTMDRRFVGSFHLLDDSMSMWGQIDRVLGADFEYPNVLWAPGEVLSQTYRLPVGRSTPPGLYTIEFGIYDNSSGAFEYLPVTLAAGDTLRKQIHLGPVRIWDPARTRSPDRPLSVRLDDQIDLVGYDLSAPTLTRSEPLALALHWQAIRPPQQDYTVFTQLIGPDGQVWAQQDNPPQGGRYPTTAWAVNDRVVDRYQLRLPEVAPPGQYRLLVGMYDPTTGQRLPAITPDGQFLPDHAIPLTTFTVQ